MVPGSAGETLYQEAKANDHGVKTFADVVELFKYEKGNNFQISYKMIKLILFRYTRYCLF